MRHFLLIYDHGSQRLLETREFGVREAEQATLAYEEAEVIYRGRPEIEIVLIGADRLETIMQTHGHYFDETSAVTKYLTGV
jgi:hypothetical protein